jgi:hypothetical protein
MGDGAESFLESANGKWNIVPGALTSEIHELVKSSRSCLPTEYLDFLQRCNGGSGCLDVPPYYLRLWPVGEVAANNLDYEMPTNIPGFLGFADAGGCDFLAFDTRTPNSWKIYSIPFVPMELRDAVLVAHDFSELLAHVVARSHDRK